MRPLADLNMLMPLYNEARMSVTTYYATAPDVVKIDGSVIGTLGNFSASIGKAKSKKTFNVTAMVAAAISGRKILNYEIFLPDDKPNVLYIDTEQGKHHCQGVMKRIHRLATLRSDIDCERLHFLSLRKYTPDERIGIIEVALREIPNIGLVIIDGIRDCLYDINSPAEATKVVTLLMQWTDHYQFHLHTILHQNKGDENARGHIGTEINNKAESIIQVEKDKSDSSVSKVEAVHTRGKEFEPFAFRINEVGLPMLMEEYNFEKAKAGRPAGEKFEVWKSISREQHRRALGLMFPTGKEQYSRSELEQQVKRCYSESYEPIGNNKVSEIITYLSNRRNIVHLDPDNQKSPWIFHAEAPIG